MMLYYGLLMIYLSLLITQISSLNLGNVNKSTEISISYTQAEQTDLANNAVFLFENRFFEFNCNFFMAEKILISKNKKVNNFFFPR